MDVEEDRRGIIPRGHKFVVNMRVPGGKMTWITVDDRNLAKWIVERIDLYVAGFKALPDDHPDVPGLLEEFRNGEFKQVVLQALESNTPELLKPPAANNFPAAEVPEGSIPSCRIGPPSRPPPREDGRTTDASRRTGIQL